MATSAMATTSFSITHCILLSPRDAFTQIDGHRRNTALLDKIIWSAQWRRSSFGTRGSRSTGERATGPKDPVRGPFTVPGPDDMANARRGR